MKKLKLSLATILLLLTCFAYAQDYNEMSINELNKLKNEAVNNEQYEKAHQYKTIIELKEKLENALAEEDYLLASKLKKQIQDVSSGKVTTVPSSNTAGNAVTKSQVVDGEYNLEFYNTVYLLDKIQNTTEQLEKKTAEIRTSSYSAVFVAGSSSYWEVEGYRSPLQLTKEGDYTFLIRVASGLDPSTLFKLQRLELLGREEKKRSLLSFKTTAAAYAGASTDQNNDSEVNISFKKVSDEVYEVVLNEVIPPGEYAFVFGNNWHLFGTKSQFINSDQEEIEERDLLRYVYDTEGRFYKSVWLGFDYSLFKIKGQLDKSEDEIKRALTESLDFLNEKDIKHSRIEGWLIKEKHMYFDPFFTKELAVKNGGDFVVSGADYDLSKEDIERHLDGYSINYPGLGLVFIPESVDFSSGTINIHAVWFDFDTRKIVYSSEISRKAKMNEKVGHRDIAGDFLYATKEYVDRDYRKKFKDYR